MIILSHSHPVFEEWVVVEQRTKHYTLYMTLTYETTPESLLRLFNYGDMVAGVKTISGVTETIVITSEDFAAVEQVACVAAAIGSSRQRGATRT